MQFISVVGICGTPSVGEEDNHYMELRCRLPGGDGHHHTASLHTKYQGGQSRVSPHSAIAVPWKVTSQIDRLKSKEKLQSLQKS